MANQQIEVLCSKHGGSQDRCPPLKGKYHNPNLKEALKGNIARANVNRKLQLKEKIPL